MHSLERQVLWTIRRHRLLENGDGVLLALSGGPDSVALLRVLLSQRKECGWKISACHVNHGIRAGESERDEEFVRDLCQECGIELTVDRLEPAADRGNLEANLRELRYDRLVRTAAKFGAVVATGHTLNDQAETLLLKLVRGAGPVGMSGIYPQIEKQDPASGGQVSIVRPLLECKRGAVLDYLKEIGQPFRDDSSNLDLENDRNWVRHHLLPELADRLNPRVVENLGRSAEVFRSVAEFAEKTALDLFAGLKIEEESDLLFEIDHLHALPLVLRNELFRLAVRGRPAGSSPLGSRHLDAINLLLTGESGRQAALPGGWSALREFGRLRFRRTSQTPFFQKEMTIPGRIDVKEIGKRLEIRRAEGVMAGGSVQAIVPAGCLIVRNRRPGDRYEYAGRTRRLKTILQEQRIPRSARDSLLVLEHKGRIVWVEGLEVAEAFRPGRERLGVLVEFSVKHLPE